MCTDSATSPVITSFLRIETFNNSPEYRGRPPVTQMLFELLTPAFIPTFSLARFSVTVSDRSEVDYKATGENDRRYRKR